MQSLTYAFQFISASFSLMLKHSRLQKTWLYFGVGSLVVLILWFLPLSIVLALIGLKPVGMILVGLISIFALVSVLVFARVFALIICRVYGTIDSDEGGQPSKWPLLPEHWMDVTLFAISLPGKHLLQTTQQIFSGGKSDSTHWPDPSYLILPVICLEDLSLSQAVQRVKEIVEEHLIRFRAELIQIGLVGGVVQWILLVGGIALGFIDGINLADPNTAGRWQRVLGAGIGMLAAWLPAMIGLVVSTFPRTIYHTALYQWVKNVEAARQTQARDKASPPEILRRVLGKYSSSNHKER